jgi:hypothetical protein
VGKSNKQPIIAMELSNNKQPTKDKTKKAIKNINQIVYTVQCYSTYWGERALRSTIKFLPF